jgi:hypothetical protein
MSSEASLRYDLQNEIVDLSQKLDKALSRAKKVAGLRKQLEEANARYERISEENQEVHERALALAAENAKQEDVIRQCRNFVIPFAISAGLIPEVIDFREVGKAPGQTKGPWVTKTEWVRAVPLLKAIDALWEKKQ